MSSGGVILLSFGSGTGTCCPAMIIIMVPMMMMMMVPITMTIPVPGFGSPGSGEGLGWVSGGGAGLVGVVGSVPNGSVRMVGLLSAYARKFVPTISPSGSRLNQLPKLGLYVL